MEGGDCTSVSTGNSFTLNVTLKSHQEEPSRATVTLGCWLIDTLSCLRPFRDSLCGPSQFPVFPHYIPSTLGPYSARSYKHTLTH